MNTIEYFKERFDLLQSANKDSGLNTIRENAFADFSRLGIPVRDEEWKYTRINSLFNKEYKFTADQIATSFSPEDLDGVLRGL